MSHTLKFKSNQYGTIRVHHNSDGSGDVTVHWFEQRLNASGKAMLERAKNEGKMGAALGDDQYDWHDREVKIPSDVFWAVAHKFFADQFCNRAIEKLEDLADELYDEAPESSEG